MRKNSVEATRLWEIGKVSIALGVKKMSLGKLRKWNKGIRIKGLVRQ